MRTVLDLHCPYCKRVTDVALLTFGLFNSDPIGGDIAIVLCCQEIAMFASRGEFDTKLDEYVYTTLLRAVDDWDMLKLDDGHVAMRSLASIKHATTTERKK